MGVDEEKGQIQLPTLSVGILSIPVLSSTNKPTSHERNAKMDGTKRRERTGKGVFRIMFVITVSDCDGR